jgi:hypothetical protein
MAATCDEHAPAVRLFDGVRPQGRTLQRWPYAAIVHAFAEDRRDEILAHQSRPEIRMRVRDDAVYDAIRERAPQLPGCGAAEGSSGRPCQECRTRRGWG